MGVLQDFREQYPQYQDVDDEDLASAMHEKYYADMDPAEYRNLLELPPLETNETVPEPTVSQTIGKYLRNTQRSLKGAIPFIGADLVAHDAELAAFDTEDAPPRPDTPSPLFRDQFFAGWDTYRANRATAGALYSADQINEARNVARGNVDSPIAGGLGTTQEEYAKMFRARRADAFAEDPEKYADFKGDFDAIQAETADRRQDLVAVLQRQLDKRATLAGQAATVPFSGATQDVLEAESFGAGAAEFLDDPLTIMAEISIRSAPNMAEALPLAAAGGMYGGPSGFAAGMGTGSALVEYRNAMVEGLIEAGIDLNDAQSLLDAVENEQLMGAIRSKARTRAGVIGVFDAASGGLASKTLGAPVKSAVAREIQNIVLQTGTQAALGAAGEAGAQLATEGEIHAGEVLAEALGEGPAAVIDVGAATVTGVRSQTFQNSVAKAEAQLNEILGRSKTPEGDVPHGTLDDPDIDAEPVTDTPSPDPVPEYSDPRLKRQQFQDQIQAMANETVPGGGVTYIRDENDAIIGRTPSQNPPWFKEMAADPETAVSVRQMQKAVNKAVAGQPLGVREQRVVNYMLDVHTGDREAQVNYARDQLEDMRETRRARLAEDALLEERDNYDAGELYEENDYLAEQSAQSRLIYELMEEAESAGIDVEQFAIKYDDLDAGSFAGKLEAEISGTRRQASPQEPAPAQGSIAASRAPVTERGQDRRGSDRGRGTDRRQARSEQVEELSTNELVDLLYTNELTGIANRRAFEEEQDLHEYVASIDADSLKFINDNLTPDAGDAMLVAVAEALDQTGVDAYHISGDEFYLGADSREELQAAVELAKATLSQQQVQSPKGHAPVNITYGIGKTKDMADGVLKEQKLSREQAGKRAPRGTAPKGTVLSVRNQTLDMSPGTNYAPMIGKRGQLPIDPNNELRLGNGRAVRIPKTPVRREHILARMQRTFGVKIFQGRVKGPKTRLGFFRRGHGEIRIRNANDIEVAAHEVAHWIDDRYPWVEKLYKEFDEEIRSVSYDVELDFEGYAEFMRLYFTQEAEAIKRTPSFYDAWQKSLAEHPKLQEMVFDVQEMMHAWTMQGARARLASKHANTPPSFIEQVRDLEVSDTLLQSALDGLRAIKTAEIDVTDGKSTEAYNKMRLALGGSNGVLEATMFYGTPGWRADKQGIELTGDSLKDVFGDHWGSDDLALYMIARRAQELATQDRENLIRDDEIDAGLALAEQFPEFEDIFEAYQDFNKRMLDFAQGGGILGTDTRAAIEEANKSYVPFHRVVESLVSGSKVNRSGNPFQRLKGGTQNINNIWDNIVNNNGLMIRMSMVNDAKRSLYSSILGANNQKGGLYAAPIQTDVAPVKIQSDQVLKKIVEAMGMDMAAYRKASATGMAATEEEAATVIVIDRMKDGMGQLVEFFKTNIDPTGDVDFYLEGGKKKWFEIADPLLWDSLQFAGPKAANLAISTFGFVSSVLRRGVVAVPVFQIKNFMRDTANAWLLSDNIKVPAARALRVATSNLSKDPAYQEMLINGGGFANRAQGLQQERKLIINPQRAAAKYDRFMGRFENANRLAEYKAARAAGKSPRRAALNSREISTDFAMRGSAEIMRYLAAAVPFLNARMQGLYRVGRQFTQRDLAMSYALRGGMLATASLALYAINKDDDRYKEEPEDKKDLYWYFYTGEGEDDYFLIPKPFESGMLFGTIPERMMQMTETGDGKEFADAISWIFMETFNADLTPQLFQPLVDLQRNKNFTGAPIIPLYLENVEPSQQFTYYTGETARELGEKMRWSPIKTEHVIRGYTGTLGTYMLAASDAMIRAATDDPFGEEPTRGDTWRENLLVKSLVDPLVNEGPPRRTKYMTDFYNMVKEAERVANTVALMQKRNNVEVETYLADPANEIQFATNPAIQAVRKQLNEIRSAIDLVRQDPQMDGDTKRVQIWDLTRQRNQLVREAVTEIDKAQTEAESHASRTAP